MPTDLAEAVLAWDELDRRATALHVRNQVPSAEFSRQLAEARREMVWMARQDAISSGCPNCGGVTEYSRSVPPEPYYCEKCR